MAAFSDRLRDYQIEADELVLVHARAGKKRTVIVMPTGAGKRHIAVHKARRATDKDRRCLFLVHRQELLDQTSKTLADFGVDHGIVKSGIKPDYSRSCQLATIQTLVKRISDIPVPDLIIIDECHHIRSASYETVLDAFSEAFVLGYTATPQRLDGRGLGKWFDVMVVGPSMRELITRGYLADYKLYAPPPPDLTGVHTVAGEYDRAELAAMVDRPRIVGDVVSHYLKYAPHTQALCFAVNIAHSKHLAEEFVARGIRAMHVDGETPKEERRAILRDFEASRFQVLCSVDILGEGLDVAGIEAVIGARPTKSLTVCLQQWGRGLRVKPSGQPCIILDHSGNSRRHGLPDEDRAWELTDDRIKLRSPDEVPITTCPACFMVLPADTEICPDCGAVLRDGDDDKGEGKGVDRGLKHEEGELVAVDTLAARRAAKIQQGLAGSLAELIEIGKARGYRYPAAWAKHVVAARERRRA